MKRLIIILLLFAATKVAGQTTGYLRFDTVRITKSGGSSELIIVNKTKDTIGILANVGGGLTRFVKPRVLNDTTFVVGLDTLTIKGVYDQRRKVDTAFSLNDSTLRIRINGNNRDIVIKGIPDSTVFSTIAYRTKGLDSLSGELRDVIADTAGAIRADLAVTNTRVAFGDANNQITDDADFTYDASTKKLNAGTGNFADSVLVGDYIRVPNGSAASPILKFSGHTSGIYSGGDNNVSIAANGERAASFSTTSLTLGRWENGGTFNLSAPSASGGSNRDGVNLVISSGSSTNSGIAGNMIFRVGISGTGLPANPLINAMAIKSGTGRVVIGGLVNPDDATHRLTVIGDMSVSETPTGTNTDSVIVKGSDNKFYAVAQSDIASGGGVSGISEVVADYGLVNVNDSTLRVDTNALLTRSYGQYKIDSLSGELRDVIADTAGAIRADFVTDHGALSGLGDDDHTQYALLAGRSGGQIFRGGTGTTDDLVFRVTSGAGTTGADMIFQGGNNGATEFGRFLNSGNFGIGDATPTHKLDVAGNIGINDMRFGYYPAGISDAATTLGIGEGALGNHTTGQRNVAIGFNALNAITTGFDNVAIGSRALDVLGTSANTNVAIGKDAGGSLTSGNGNVFVGSSVAVSQTSGSNNISIGSSTALPSTTGSNQLNIGNSLYSNTLGGANFLLGFGGLSSAFPGIQRSGTDLAAVLGDGSAYTNIRILPEAYGSGWENDSTAATKKDIYNKIESLGGGGISGLTAGRVTLSTGSTSIGDDANLLYSSSGGGKLSIGTTSTAGRLNIGGNVSSIVNTGAQSYFEAATYNDATTSASSTASLEPAFNHIAAPTLTATNSSITTLNATTLHVAAPIQGTNQTLVTPFGISTNGALGIGGGMKVSVELVSENTTLNHTHNIVAVNANSGNVTVTLPDATTYYGFVYTIKRIDNSGNTVTVNTTSSQTIDGATSKLLAVQYNFIRVVSDGSNWLVIGDQ